MRRNRSLRCPHCHGVTRCVDSRFTEEGRRRRRECSNCEARFNTYELVEYTYILKGGGTAQDILNLTQQIMEIVKI